MPYKERHGITLFETPIVEVFPIDTWWVSLGKRAVVLQQRKALGVIKLY
jgi:hypothetical protein